MYYCVILRRQTRIDVTTSPERHGSIWVEVSAIRYKLVAGAKTVGSGFEYLMMPVMVISGLVVVMIVLKKQSKVFEHTSKVCP